MVQSEQTRWYQKILHTAYMHVAIIYSKPTKRLLATAFGETDEDSSVIAKMVARGLEASKITTTLYPISEDSIDSITNIHADCIFNLIEWCGLDICLSEKAFAYLRALKTPVTGSSEKLFVLTGDKIEMKKAFREKKIPTPKGLFFKTGEEDIPDLLNYPIIVKPSLEHCSVGLSYDSLANNKQELRKIVVRQLKNFKQKVLAEEFIVGREMLVYLFEEKSKVRVLPIEEVLFTKNHPTPFQTYESKWEVNHNDYLTSEVIVAKLTREEQKVIESTCINTFKKMGLRGYSRFDVRLKAKVPYILETNANSSVYDTDIEIENINEEVIPGIKFPDYLLKIVESALYHNQLGHQI